MIRSAIKDVKETDTEIFSKLSTFLTTLIFETDFLVAIDEELLEDAPPEQLEEEKLPVSQMTEHI